jgi:hypothetical protein
MNIRRTPLEPWKHVVPALAVLLVAGPARAAPEPTPAWYSGFEQGFPGEFLDYDNGTYTDQDAPNPGKTEAWSIVGADKFSDILVGEHVYKGWVTGEAADSHRAYPVVYLDVPTPLVNSFWVYLDVDYDKLDPQTDWVHFGTWANNEDWNVHTMSVLGRKLEMAHLKSWSYIGQQPQADFPLRQWVRLTVYIHYPPGGDGSVCVWQDGEAVLAGQWDAVQGQNLRRAHWGEYAAKSVDHGTQYNDEIQIWTLSEPLPGCSGAEPASPYPQPGDTDTDSSGGPDTTADDTGPGATTTGDSSGSDAPGDTGSASAATGPDADEASGCACAVDRGVGAGWLLLGVPLLARRRRRG